MIPVESCTAVFQQAHGVSDGQREVKLNVIPVNHCTAVFQQAHRIPDGKREVHLTQCVL